TIPDAAPANVIVSPTGIIHVLGYTPAEGEPGVPITVRIHFHPELADAMFVRLVIGHKAVATKVRELPGTVYGCWELDAVAPPFDREQYSSSKVLISVQALNEENAVLDSVVFGEFSYWSPTCTPDLISSTAIQPVLTTRSTRPPAPDGPTMRRRGTTLSHVPSSAAERASLAAQSQAKLRIHRRVKTPSIVRSKHTSLPHDHAKLIAQTPILELVTPLANICTGWTPAELAAGRRLVRFAKVQDGKKLIVSCEPIRQEEYSETDTVISCIYREEADSCYVTSVDVIYLLERLTNGEFPVEEKNRIRRNLEGLRPTTVSKHKAGFGDFFQRIMEFPDPKPRNIEKDLKVFDWNLLGQALEKILSKYTIYVSPDQEEPSTSASVSSGSPMTDPSPLDSPELSTLQLAYPDDVQIKYEVTPAELQLFANTNASDAFMSPVDSASSSSSSSLLPQFTTDLANPGVQPDDISPWNGALKPDSMDSLAVLASYEAMDPLETVQGFAENTPMDFNIYDNFNFSATHPLASHWFYFSWVYQ
ncbi:hypothetical protein EST38_g12238, partial [Candolleomyces aberdarensis]